MSLHPNDEIILKSGDVGPDFTLANVDGMQKSLFAYTAVSPLILIFYRGDW